MNAFDYMSLVSEYIINNFKDKKDLKESVVFNIKPFRDPYTKELFYEVNGNINSNKQIFYLKFPCYKKDNFYSSVKCLILDYVSNDNFRDYYFNNDMFSIVTKNSVYLNIVLEDNLDKNVFIQIKEYLDFKLKNNTFEQNMQEMSDIYAKKLKKYSTNF